MIQNSEGKDLERNKESSHHSCVLPLCTKFSD